MTGSGEDLDLTQTLTGRLRNFPLSPSPDNALLGVYEAVSNSLHAIRDIGDTRKGRIIVEVHRADDGDIDSFTITDNGIGLNAENFASFRKIDSTFKSVRGGKGVGRLSWLKIFDHVRVASVFHDQEQGYRRKFEFHTDDVVPIKAHTLEEDAAGNITTINLNRMKSDYRRECPKKSETIGRSIIRHFLKDLISSDSPDILLIDGEEFDLKKMFSNSIVRSIEDSFSIKIGEVTENFKITHLVAEKAFTDHEVKENTIYLLAHGRVVAKRAVGGLIGLKKLQGGRTYLGLVEGPYLDQAVAQERTAIISESNITDDIVRNASSSAVIFLTAETQPVRDRQMQMVQQIKKEYPRFIGTLSEEKKFVDEKLPLSVRDQESVFRAVSLEWYRGKRRVDRSIRAGLSNPKNDIEFKKALAEAAKSIAAESKAILADYVTERKVVIDFLSRLVARVRESDNYEFEARVHDLVLPRKANSSNIKFETHNLWLIDERLPYYYYFNSDLPLKEQVDTSEDRRRPDITLSDVASAFQQRGSNEPFIVVEFKRPGRDDYSAKDDPVKQCLDYVLEMKSGSALTSADGAWISAVQENTLFYCYVIADITPTLKKLLDFHDMKRGPDGRGYFKFHEGLRAWCEIIPYDKLIELNRVRHNAFFEKLGLS